MTNVSTILVSPEGNVFVGVTGEADMTVADGKWATDSIRREIFCQCNQQLRALDK